MNIQINTITCKRCNHVWVPRKTPVRLCAKCHSAYWDIEFSQKKLKAEDDSSINK